MKQLPAPARSRCPSVEKAPAQALDPSSPAPSQNSASFVQMAGGAGWRQQPQRLDDPRDHARQHTPGPAASLSPSSARLVELGQAIAPVLRTAPASSSGPAHQPVQAQAAQRPPAPERRAGCRRPRPACAASSSARFLVQAPGGAGPRCQIAQHRRLEGGGLQQILEAARRARSRPLMVADQRRRLDLARRRSELRTRSCLAHPVGRVQRSSSVRSISLRCSSSSHRRLAPGPRCGAAADLQPQRRSIVITIASSRASYRCGRTGRSRLAIVAARLRARTSAAVAASRPCSSSRSAQGTLGRRQPRRPSGPRAPGTAGQQQRARTRTQALAQQQTPYRILS